MMSLGSPGKSLDNRKPDGRKTVGSFARRGERLARQVPAVEVQQVERIENDVMSSMDRTMLQHLERRSSVGIQRDDFTVDNRAIRFQFGPGRAAISGLHRGKASVVPRSDLKLRAVLHEERAIASLCSNVVGVTRLRCQRIPTARSHPPPRQRRQMPKILTCWH